MVSPWTGPPYNLTYSYEFICNRLLTRLSCNGSHSVNNPHTYTCSCGAFTAGSARVAQLLVDVITQVLPATLTLTLTLTLTPTPSPRS